MKRDTYETNKKSSTQYIWPFVGKNVFFPKIFSFSVWVFLTIIIKVRERPLFFSLLKHTLSFRKKSRLKKSSNNFQHRYSFRLEFGRSNVLTHPRPSHTKNGNNSFSVWCFTYKLSWVNNASAYAVGLRLTMLLIYLAEAQKKRRSAPLRSTVCIHV